MSERQNIWTESDLLPAEGNWGQWGVWEPCLADCGDSIQYRRRECNDPAPANGGRNCPRDQGTDQESRVCDDNGPDGTRTCTAGG